MAHTGFGAKAERREEFGVIYIYIYIYIYVYIYIYINQLLGHFRLGVKVNPTPSMLNLSTPTVGA